MKREIIVFLYPYKKDEHFIKEAKPDDEGKCQSGVDATRQVVDSFHDGSAPANVAPNAKEREKLKEKGFVVS